MSRYGNYTNEWTEKQLKRIRRQQKLRAISAVLILSCSINLTVTGSIQALKRPDLTETQRFLLIPQNFIYHFK